MKLIIVTLTLFLISFINGCSTTNDITYSKKAKVKSGFQEKSVESVYIDYGIFADEVTRTIFKKNEMPKSVIVTDFVDVTSLDNHTRLGYVLSGNIKNSLINHYQIDVIEAEVSKYFKISGNGLKILSRDINKLRTTNFDVKYAVVGTYTYSVNELIIFVKLIDLETGLIKGSYAKTFPMSSGTQMMLTTK